MPFELYQRFVELDAIARQRWPTADEPGFEHLGIFFNPEPGPWGYDWCTPTNSLVFGGLGFEGIHFSLILRNGIITADSPVIVTTPSNLGISRVIGRNFHDFLCLSCLRGFFCLGIIEVEEYQPIMSDWSWTATSPAEFGWGFGTDEIKEEMLAFLREELNLQPWTDPAGKLLALEKEFFEELIFPESFFE